MRVAIIGQQDFGKATLEAFLNRGDEVAAVFCAPEKGRPDPLRLAAEQRGVPVHQLPKLTDPAAQEAMRSRQGRYRRDGLRHPVRPAGLRQHPEIRHDPVPPQPAAAASRRLVDELGDHLRPYGDRLFSIFRPTDGLDEGPVILTRAVQIEAEDTLGSLYFGKIFPMGVAGLVEVADLVVAGKAPALAQYEPDAGYEGIIRDAETRINWASHVDLTYNLIRGVQSGARRLDHARREKAVPVRVPQAHRPHLLRGEGQEARRGRGGHRCRLR